MGTLCSGSTHKFCCYQSIDFSWRKKRDSIVSMTLSAI